MHLLFQVRLRTWKPPWDESATAAAQPSITVSAALPACTRALPPLPARPPHALLPLHAGLAVNERSLDHGRPRSVENSAVVPLASAITARDSVAEFEQHLDICTFGAKSSLEA